MDGRVYGGSSRDRFTRALPLDGRALSVGFQVVPLAELNLLAMADAYPRGQWLDAAGAERPVRDFGTTRGAVPVTRASGDSTPVKARRPAESVEFAEALGGLAVRHSGGPGRVRPQAGSH